MTAPLQQSDDELLHLSSGGNEEAFVALYRRRSGPVFRFAMRLCGSESAAEEITQEVFLTLARDPKRFDPTQGTLSSFLFGITRNLALRRMENGRQTVPLEHEGTGAPVHESLIDRRDPHGVLDRNERIERVRRAVLALPEHYRDVVVLCDLEEVSYADAADTLGCSIGTVRSRLHRGRGLLLDKLRSTEAGERAPSGAATKRCFV